MLPRRESIWSVAVGEQYPVYYAAVATQKNSSASWAEAERAQSGFSRSREKPLLSKDRLPSPREKLARVFNKEQIDTAGERIRENLHLFRSGLISRLHISRAAREKDLSRRWFFLWLECIFVLLELYFFLKINFFGEKQMSSFLFRRANKEREGSLQRFFICDCWFYGEDFFSLSIKIYVNVFVAVAYFNSTEFLVCFQLTKHCFMTEYSAGFTLTFSEVCIISEICQIY